jgi:hypothetical protein
VIVLHCVAALFLLAAVATATSLQPPRYQIHFSESAGHAAYQGVLEEFAQASFTNSNISSHQDPAHSVFDR